jgi:hypothetical protein
VSSPFQFAAWHRSCIMQSPCQKIKTDAQRENAMSQGAWCGQETNALESLRSDSCPHDPISPPIPCQDEPTLWNLLFFNRFRAYESTGPALLPGWSKE